MAKTTGFSVRAKVQVFRGASMTGKTQRLLEEVVALLREGTNPSDVLVLCATPTAAQEARRRLVALDERAQSVEVTVPQACFLGILGTDEARSLTGRQARLLLPFEYDFFLEDLKTSGIRPGRLREMLKFLYKSMADLECEDEDWLVTNEERGVVTLMRESLAFAGGMLNAEVAPLAVSCLRKDEGIREQWSRRFVVVDDFHLLSRASQVGAGLLARERLMLAADPDAVCEVFEAYPNGDGARELMDAYPDAQVETLHASFACAGATHAGNALRRSLGNDDVLLACYAEEGVEGNQDLAALESASEAAKGAAASKGADEGGKGAVAGDLAESDQISVTAAKSPGDEMRIVCELVEQALNDGTCATDVVVAAVHPAWRANVARCLRESGVPAQTLSDARFLRCDVRRSEGGLAARIVTLLSLIADPSDGVAWRCWCGFGDYLTNSNGMRSLRMRFQADAAGLASVLSADMLQPESGDKADAVASLGRIKEAHAAALELMAGVEGLQGEALLDAIAAALGAGASDVAPLKRLCLDGGQEASPCTMVLRLRDALIFPVFSDEPAVRVVSYEDLAGLSPRTLVLAGFLNGFFPSRSSLDSSTTPIDRMKCLRERDTRRMAGVAAKATSNLAVTYCTKLGLEDAERLKLCIDRIFFEKGTRVAVTEPSIFLETMLGN